MKDQKFIMVKDEAIANKLIANGFQVISRINNMYTFINQTPQHFNFEDIDIKKLVYTDRLIF